MIGLKNIIVVGGSYVGRGTAERLAKIAPPTHRILLIEPHSHFHHLFTFPRFAIVPGYEHKAFIPYTGTLTTRTGADAHAIVPARVSTVRQNSITLDREWEGQRELEFDYLVVATGSTLTQPSGLPFDDKTTPSQYLRKHQERVKMAQSILVVGGGAAGVQMATDIKETYPDKKVTVVHSREHLMPKFHPNFHQLIAGRFKDLGIDMITGTRVSVPAEGFSSTTSPQRVTFTNGASITTDFVILTTGQKANSSLLEELDASTQNSVLNPENGMIRVQPTLQFSSPALSNFFAVGDIADTGAHKAARPGMAQADVVTANIDALLQNKVPSQTYTKSPAAIHITLGMKYNVVFRNPNIAEGQSEPTVIEKEDGREDMNVESMWERLGVQVKTPNEYHL